MRNNRHQQGLHQVISFESIAAVFVCNMFFSLFLGVESFSYLLNVIFMFWDTVTQVAEGTKKIIRIRFHSIQGICYRSINRCIIFKCYNSVVFLKCFNSVVFFVLGTSWPASGTY